jgi:hypothetical protein
VEASRKAAAEIVIESATDRAITEGFQTTIPSTR